MGALFGFMFVLGLFVVWRGETPEFIDSRLSGARPSSGLPDFIERLRFVRGELHFDADYIRGRRIYKTRIAVGANGNSETRDHRSRKGGITLARAAARKKNFFNWFGESPERGA